MKSPILGILGGMGPMSSVYFYELITAHTAVSCDQDHIDIIISSMASTPDRTDYIIGRSNVSPLASMIESARGLESLGASIISIPCNTAHYFYDRLAEAINIPLIHIIKETVDAAYRHGARHLGIFATEGTLSTNTYDRVCAEYGIMCSAPDDIHKAMLMDIIYNYIKVGKCPPMDKFNEMSAAMLDMGCDRIILGCTELSLLKRDYYLDFPYIDSLDALALASINACGKTPVGLEIR